MKFEQAIRRLEISPKMLFWCPEWGLSKWGIESIDYLESCYKKGIIKSGWHWMEWEDKIIQENLYLDAKYMELLIKLQEMTCFQPKWASTNKEYLDDPYFWGTLFCANSVIRIFIKKDEEK